MEELVTKYLSIIQSEDKDLWEKYAQILEKSVNYLKNNNKIDVYTKVSATYVVKELFLKNNDFNLKDVESTIDKFFNHKKNEYDNYINDLAMITDQLDCDVSFYNKFVKILNESI